MRKKDILEVIMKKVNYITKENILYIVNQLKPSDKIVTDNIVVKQLIEKYNPLCNEVHYYSRRYLHTAIERTKPTVTLLLFNSPKTISLINSLNANITIYTLDISEEELRINTVIEELENALN